MRQLANHLGERDKGKLPSQSVNNPKACSIRNPSNREHVQAIVTLRSGKRVDNQVANLEADQAEKEEQKGEKGDNQKEGDAEPSIVTPDAEIPVILGRPFLAMANALINCRSGVMKISFGNMTVELNIFHIRKQPLDYDQMNQVCLIEEIIDEVIEESSIEDSLEACLAQFGEDLDLEKLMKQADALLETTPLVSSDGEQ
jgi:hypothetical protein